MTHPDIPPAIRGTFAALGHPASIAHLTRLGITTVELMPSAAWMDERHLPPLNLSNYWGYNPMAFLAPDPRLAPGGWPEVRAAVDALHEAGLTVILDVVLNHSGESDELGPTVSMRGLDNAGYYRLAADRSLYVNDAGCGNILAMDRPATLRLGMDALRAWAIYGGLDGFRLDLATTLGRRQTGFDRDAPLLPRCEQDPILSRCVIIAEPWDIGPGGYQLGAFPARWGEWNDRFRDTARRFWRGDAGMLGDFATRFAGSADMFLDRPLSPLRSTTSSPMTASPWPIWSPTKPSGTTPTARIIATARTTICPGTTAPKARQPTRRSWPPGPATCAPCWPPCCCRAAPRCCPWATNSAAPSTATTTPMRRTTLAPGSTGPPPTRP